MKSGRILALFFLGLALCAVANAQDGCGDTLNWTSSSCQVIGAGQLNTAMVNGANDPNAWTVISRHGEYAQNETECNIPGALSVNGGILDIAINASSASCGDFSPTTGNACPATGCASSGNVAPSSFPYTTGDVQWNTFNFQYGTIVWRGQVPPPTTRLWPAFWTLTSRCQNTNKYTGETPATDNTQTCPDVGQSGYQEIDMMDCYNYTGNPNQCGFHIANPSFGIGGNCDAYPEDTLGTVNYAIPHVWAMNWTSNNIKMYWDGSVINGTGCSTSLSSKQFFLMQTQTGGTAGTPVKNLLPAHQTLDYIKVCDTGLTVPQCTSATGPSDPTTGTWTGTLGSHVIFYDDFNGAGTAPAPPTGLTAVVK